MTDVTRTRGGAVYVVGVAVQDVPWNTGQATTWRLTRRGFVVMPTPQIDLSGLSGISAGGGNILAVGGTESQGPVTLRLTG